MAVPARGAPGITGKSAVLLDAESGQVLYEVDKDEKLPPASTTKILTAILAIESGRIEEIATIGSNPPRVEGTRVYLEEGERIKLRELVLAALVHSANDAALAIAEHMAGSGAEFAKMMNDKAREIGALNSHFVNPHGLHDDDHYSTAYDLALIGQYAMKNETFREMVQAKVLDWEGQAWQTRLININKLLWSYEGANGIKTGYTTNARNTIVASAVRENRSYIAVVLGSSTSDIWQDATFLLDYGFKNYQRVELANPAKVVASVNIDAKRKLTLVPANEFSLSIPRGGDSIVESRVVIKPYQNAIKKGEAAGQAIYCLDGKEAGRVDLLAGNDVDRPFNFAGIVIYTAAGFFFLQICWRTYQLFRRKRRRSYGLGSYYREY